MKAELRIPPRDEGIVHYLFTGLPQDKAFALEKALRDCGTNASATVCDFFPTQYRVEFWHNTKLNK